MTDLIYLGCLFLLLIIVFVGDIHIIKYMNKPIEYIKKPYHYVKKKLKK